MQSVAAMARPARLRAMLVALVAGASFACGPDIGRVPDAPTATSPSSPPESEVSSPSPSPSAVASSPPVSAGTEASDVDDRVARILEDFDVEDGAGGTLVSIDAADLFDPGSIELTAAGTDRLDHLLEALLLLDDAPVTINGHSDVPGDGADPRLFAHRRSAAVAVYVVMEGLDKDRLTVDGFDQSEDQRIDVILPTVDLDELSSP